LILATKIASQQKSIVWLVGSVGFEYGSWEQIYSVRFVVDGML
jgi:hypothetical protein